MRSLESRRTKNNESVSVETVESVISMALKFPRTGHVARGGELGAEVFETRGGTAEAW